ncbi:hypothetical protein Rsub_08710 [Raphidocelis subcapitata]|uniref:Enkurin domain-containing protein n=1 Tax=Raphidocelis subcapitata TaxID=307507 RepID=A0A2V0P793_9CHLO|nr:hypothetical protein Rsub_08710 [Raphidocelis subcapitata]|eukprot:GBF95728.1 hypothetical protein Rsub_08710 [Raphidocelis subcapitata]
MRGGQDESVYALGAAPPGAAHRTGAGSGARGPAPRVVTHRVAAPSSKVKMHVDSSQVESCLNPVRGVRDAQRRAGIKPTDHARQNALAVKERSRLNALSRLSQQEDRQQQADVAPRRARTGPAPRAGAGGALGAAAAAWRGAGAAAAAVPSSAGGPPHQQLRAAAQCQGGCGAGPAAPRDFVEENRLAAAAARHAAKAEARRDAGVPFTQKREYGQVPAYLVERKLQMAQEEAAREAARQAALIPAGMRVMPEEERTETLALLERNRGEVEAALAAMPIVVETAGMRRRKDELERRLAEVAEATRVFSRKQVLVRL